MGCGYAGVRRCHPRKEKTMTAILIYTAFCAWAALFHAGVRAHVFLVRWLLAPVVIMTVSVATIVIYVASLGERCIAIDWCDE